MTVQAPEFPTFCHISELGAAGYADLHAMVAVSRPLNLWAPSSVLLSSPECRITPGEFVGLVDAGHIRVVAREEWLVDRGFRDNRPWSGARWEPEVDSALKTIMEDDLAEPDVRRRRVLAVGPESGRASAERMLAADPVQLRYWTEMLGSAEADRVIPAGVLENARRRGGTDLEKQAVEIVRDAWNHGDAMVECGADIPFLMRAEDRAFADLLARVPTLPHQAGGPVPGEEQAVRERPAQEVPLAEVTGQMLEALRRVEMDRTDIVAFTRSAGHAALVAWFAAICARIRADGVADTDVDVRAELVRQLTQDGFPGLSLDALRRPTMTEGVESVTLGIDLQQLLSGTAGIGTFLTMSAATFSVGRGLARRLGWVPGMYRGDEWPYLYAGKRVTAAQQRALLGRLQADEPR
ncbi:hypothetical protein ACGFX4_36230 [Kitasatospora sp. NPDC048365]|uniref:hypothetical protein n=1 Tax=Kitasatospora sp. NPDC048365 TaxID=3364050 RepID=UPI003716DAA7